jgi:hypothetical protein
MVVFFVLFEMVGEPDDAGRENRYLHFGRAGVVLVDFVCLDNGRFFFFEHNYTS